MSYENLTIVSPENVKAEQDLLLVWQGFHAELLEQSGTLDRAREYQLDEFEDFVDDGERELGIDLQEFDFLYPPLANGEDFSRVYVGWVSLEDDDSNDWVPGLIFQQTVFDESGESHMLKQEIPLELRDENGSIVLCDYFTEADLELVQALIIELGVAKYDGLLANLSEDLQEIKDPRAKIGNAAVNLTK